MLNKFKQLLGQSTLATNLYRMSRPVMDKIYRVEDLNDSYYSKIKISGDTELEHQIGRLTNFKKIVDEIESKKINGDVVEFGTWRGFSLLWIAYFLERAGVFNKKIIGVDGFVGLPNTEGVFLKNAFNDTSERLCRDNIMFSKDLYHSTKKNISIEKNLYSEKSSILNKIGGKKFCLIHIDCDISSSLLEIFSILEDGSLIGDTCYLCFDDYGVMDSYKKTVDELVKTLDKKWTIKDHSKTSLTKNFLLERR